MCDEKIINLFMKIFSNLKTVVRVLINRMTKKNNFFIYCNPNEEKFTILLWLPYSYNDSGCFMKYGK